MLISKFRAMILAKRPAFTLIELLVVVTIIVALLALLMPGIEKALEQAERAVCAANLHGWGNALSMQSADNKNKLMDTYMSGPTPLPVAIWVTTTTKQINVAAIEPYLQGYNKQTHTFSGAWLCPATRTKQQDTWGYGSGQNYFHSQYSYYSGVDQWKSYASFPDQLTKRRFGESTVLMADTIYRWNEAVPFAGQTIGTAWLYNHSNGSNPWPTAGSGGFPSDITGLNRLYADGRVQWNGDLNVAKINSTDIPDPTIPWVATPGTTNGAMNWY